MATSLDIPVRLMPGIGSNRARQERSHTILSGAVRCAVSTVVILMLAASAASAQGDGAVVVRVGDGSAVTVLPAFSDGFLRDFTLPVDADFSLATGLDVGELSVRVTWDPNRIEFVGLVEGSQGTVVVDGTQVTGGLLDLSVTSSPALNATFTLAHVTFRSTFQGGSNPSPPTLALINLELLTARSGAGADIGAEVALLPLSLCACGGIHGDVTGDGVLNTFDWIDVARFAFNGSPPLSGTPQGVQDFGDVTVPFGTFNTFDWIDIARVGFGFEPLSPASSVAGEPSTTRSIAQLPDDLLFLRQPTDVAVDSELPAVTVAVVDASDTPVADFNGQVTVGLITSNLAGGPQLNGTLSQTAQGGIAVFHDLSVNEDGIGFSLSATDGSGLLTASGTFDVSPLISSNANLGSLSLDDPATQLNEQLDLENTTDYTADVLSGTASITVSATAADGGAQGVTIDGTASTSEVVALGAPGTSTPILIVVTAEDGTQRTYTVTIRRANAQPGPPEIQLDPGVAVGANFDVTFTTGLGPISVSPQGTVSDPDDVELTHLSFFMFIRDRGDEFLVFAGDLGDVAIDLQTAGTRNVNVDGTALRVVNTPDTFDGTEARVRVEGSSGGPVSVSVLTTLLRGVRYENIANSPTASPRRLEIFTNDDSGGAESVRVNISIVSPTPDPVPHPQRSSSSQNREPKPSDTSAGSLDRAGTGRPA